MKHSGMPKNLMDKLFHEEVVELIKSEQVGEDSYRLVVLTEKIDVKLPSILDEEDEIATATPKPASKTSSKPVAKPSSAPKKTPAPSSVPSSDPCSHSSYGARSC
jgi:hypothetical protein